MASSDAPIQGDLAVIKLSKEAQALYDWMQAKPDTSQVTDAERSEIGRRVALASESGYMGHRPEARA